MAAQGGVSGRPVRSEFTAEGYEELREAVKTKLGEFMGDYTDDSLVEYVMVLLKGGRQREEATKDLHVFLGEQSASFVSWLWEFLSSNSHIYVQHDLEPLQSDMSIGLTGRLNFPVDHSKYEKQAASDTGGASNKISVIQTKKELKGLARDKNEAFPLRSLVTDILHADEKRERKKSPAKHVLAHLQNHRKRNRDEESQLSKKEQSSQSAVGASRLLQFAVRDAVKTAQQKSFVEPAIKRLRSVVLSSTDGIKRDSRLRRPSRVLQVPGAALALKAAAEAAEDVNRVRYFGSVFDRLGQGKKAENRGSLVSHVEEQHDADEFEEEGLDHFEYRESENDKEHSGDMAILDGSEMIIDSVSDDSVVNDEVITRDDENSAWRITSSYSSSLPSVTEKRVAIASHVNVHQYDQARLVDEDRLTSPRSPSKVVNGSASANTRVLPKNQTATEVQNEDECPVGRSSITEKADSSFIKESTTFVNIKEPKASDPQKESQSTTRTVVSSYATSHPMEDPDSRTLYVNNVHFAATKDTLSRHFNQFGAVLKVIIVTNAATGQPTGAAYVEFLHKESAERALSLNGTSFMNRTLKVVQRSAHEAAQFYGWSGSARSSIYASMHSRMPYPRAVLSGTYRGRVPVKAGARSLQWKREPAMPQSASGVKSAITVPMSAEQVPPSIAQ